MGIVTDSKVAKVTPCKCYSLNGDLCFSKGIMGALSKEQIGKYCTERIFKEGNIVKRFEKYAEAADECKGLPWDEFWECVDQKFKKKETIKILEN